jgi:hypothetical protein
MKNIVIIGHEPLTPRVYKIFNIYELRIAGYNVEYRDISQLLFPGIKIPDEIEDKGLKKISTLNEYILSFEIDDSKECIYIAELQNLWKNRKIFRILKKNNRFVVRLSLYSTMILPLSLWQKIQMHRGNYCELFLNKVQEFAYKIYQIIHNFYPYDIEITSCSKFGSGKLQVFTINHPDFELTKSLKDTIPTNTAPYAVFLDEYFPYHPDFEFHSGIKTSEQVGALYQQKMCKFFDEIEAKYNLKIVIAAHPKSLYSERAFEHREIIKYHTCELVKYAQFVIMHGSASFDFAVVYKKPLIIASVKDFSNFLDMKQRTEYLSSYFNCPLVNLDSKVYDIPDPNIDIVACKEFLYTYMTSKEKEGMKNIDILIDIFNNL